MYEHFRRYGSSASRRAHRSNTDGSALAVCFEALEELRGHADGPSRDPELLDE